MTHIAVYCRISPHIAASRRGNAVPLRLKTREQAAPQQRASSLHSACTVLAFGNREAPTEIRDTPKVFPNTPKVILNV